MSNTNYFEYGEKEKQWLRSRDPVLSAAMDEIGHVHREVQPDLFKALINSIVGQQISTKAHVTIWNRMQERFAPITPENFENLRAEDIQTCGISMRKALYIKSIADAVSDGGLDLTLLPAMTDAEISASLVQLKGIGLWTAEMLMIFSMNRLNVLSYGDLAIHRGLRMLYRHREITPALFAKYQRRFHPYNSVASLYLWQIASGVIPELTDPKPKNKPINPKQRTTK